MSDRDIIEILSRWNLYMINNDIVVLWYNIRVAGFGFLIVNMHNPILYIYQDTDSDYWDRKPDSMELNGHAYRQIKRKAEVTIRNPHVDIGLISLLCDRIHK